MNILVINCGSSSVKADVIDTRNNSRLVGLEVERVKEANPIAHFDGEENPVTCPASGCIAVLEFVLPLIEARLGDKKIEGVGHRVAHGGEKFDQPTLITEETITEIQALSRLAPLHQPIHLQGIEVARKHFPALPQVAVFDTAFHSTLPKRAIAYALPKALATKHHLRRYGFHGTSHLYVAEAAAHYLGTELKNLRLITCHLGSGCSVAAIEYGRSVETSMGLTPLEGLVMGTRVGDVDAGLLIQLAKDENLSLQQLEDLLNKESGLKGISGSNDMRDIINRAADGDDDCRLALQVFSHRLRKYIGAYAAVMGGVDAIIFTAGIGENSAVVRHRTCQRLDYMGAVMDEDLNNDLRLSDAKPVADFSAANSRVKLLAVRTDEQMAIARESGRIIEQQTKVNTVPKIPVAVSARHIHLTQEVVEQLFGKGYQLTEKAPLSQPGQYAANETVTIVGPKNKLERVRILGPCRDLNQLEISRTDEFFLGLDAPVRASGKIENSPGIKVIGPAGEVSLQNGVICAWRHIHMTPQDAEVFEVADGDIVEVQVGSGIRQLTFGNVLIRVSPKFKLEMHIDTDEANAADLPPLSEGDLVETAHTATLTKRKLSH